MSIESPCDFFQYYAGALVVRNGIWDSLYPIPKAEVFDEPSHFVPEYRTFLLDPTASSNPAFYPALSLPVASDRTPKLAACFPQERFWSYIYPPPAALLLWPLSFIGFDTAAYRLWPTISVWSIFALSFFASRIHRLLRKRNSYTEGLIILACLAFVFRGRTDVAAGNITPLISGLIAFSTYALIRGRLFAFSCALIPMFLFKTIGLTWLPLLLFKQAYWRAFLFLAVIALLLNGIVVGLAGVGVYEKFFLLAPKITVPAGIGIVPSLLTIFGFYPKTLYLVLDFLCLAALYYGFWKQRIKHSPENDADDAMLVVAVLAGTIALYCLLNFSVWFPYCPNYLFFPFLGWILQEGYLASNYWRYSILGCTAFGFMVMSGEWIVKGALFHLFGKASVGFYHTLIFEPCFVLVIPAGFLIVALRRLHGSQRD